MGHKYAEIAFTDAVKQVQLEHNSRSGYERMEQGEDYNFLLSQQEASFIEARDSFYMASVSETDWPYVQHRGGPKGFMRVIDAKTIGFADFSGNRQYVSAGNFRNNNRVSLFFMDYPNKTRLKLLGRVERVADEDWETLAKLEVDSYRARVERGYLIHIEAFDWNCPQHITPRYTEDEIQQLIDPLMQENQRLKALVDQTPQAGSPNEIGEGPLELVISGIRQLTPSVRAYEFRHVDGQDLPEVTAGAHLKIPIRLDSGALIYRHYSICSNPKRRDIYEIAVLRIESETSEDASGSSVLHDSFQLGQVIRCELPNNYFQVRDDTHPIVLIAGGIGVTPIKAIAQSFKSKDQPHELHYAGRSRREMPFLDRLEREFGDRLRVYSKAESQRMNIRSILATAPENASFYVCGPQAMIDDVIAQGETLGISPERIVFERFVSAPVKDAKPIKISLIQSDKQVVVEADETVLDALINAGVDVNYSCKTGECKSCAVKVISGQVDHRDSVLMESEKTEQGLMCPCVSRAKGDSLALDL